VNNWLKAHDKSVRSVKAWWWVGERHDDLACFAVSLLLGLTGQNIYKFQGAGLVKRSSFLDQSKQEISSTLIM